MSLGTRIRDERKALGLSLKQFADLVGTSISSLQRVETGARSPSVHLLIEIANLCRKPLSYFLEEELQGFKKFESIAQKTIRKPDYEVSILCPYGLIARDVLVSRFRGNKGAVIEPRRQKGYCWVYIMEGDCVFEHDGVAHALKAGDTFFYDADKPQRLRILSALESIRITVGS